MGKNKELLAEDTVIVWKTITVGEYRNFFEHAIGKDFAHSADTINFQKNGGDVMRIEYLKDYMDTLKEFHGKKLGKN